MKKVILTLFCLLMLNLGLQAQDSPRKYTSFPFNSQSLKEIGCSAEQVKKITEIRKAIMDERKKVIEDVSLSERDKKLEQRKLIDKSKVQMMEVLTDEQKQKVEEFNKKAKEEKSEN